jgi:hypothetical protein
MDGGGRTRREHAIESNAGAIAECVPIRIRSDFAKSASKGTRSVPYVGSSPCKPLHAFAGNPRRSAPAFHPGFQVFRKTFHGRRSIICREMDVDNAWHGSIIQGLNERLFKGFFRSGIVSF